MDFNLFKNEDLSRLADKAKEKFGNTDAFKEFEQKTSGIAQQMMDSNGKDLTDIFSKFGSILNLSPASDEAQGLVGKLQNLISDKFGTCSKDILSKLGQMFISGDSITEKIEKAGGKGTANFIQKAIEIFCK